MAKKNGPRNRITLKCSECKDEVKRSEKNKRNTPERLSLSGFCPKCGHHTILEEKK